jgi:hypothetical protein
MQSPLEPPSPVQGKLPDAALLATLRGSSISQRQVELITTALRRDPQQLLLLSSQDLAVLLGALDNDITKLCEIASDDLLCGQVLIRALEAWKPDDAAEALNMLFSLVPDSDAVPALFAFLNRLDEKQDPGGENWTRIQTQCVRKQLSPKWLPHLREQSRRPNNHIASQVLAFAIVMLVRRHETEEAKVAAREWLDSAAASYYGSPARERIEGILIFASAARCYMYANRGDQYPLEKVLPLLEDPEPEISGHGIRLLGSLVRATSKPEAVAAIVEAVVDHGVATAESEREFWEAFRPRHAPPPAKGTLASPLDKLIDAAGYLQTPEAIEQAKMWIARFRGELPAGGKGGF